MPECRIASLNEAFGHGNSVRFATGNGNLEKLILAQGEASAEIYLQGAQVTRYRPFAGVDALYG